MIHAHSLDHVCVSGLVELGRGAPGLPTDPPLRMEQHPEPWLHAGMSSKLQLHLCSLRDLAGL